MNVSFLQNQADIGSKRPTPRNLTGAIRQKWPEAIRSLTDRDDLFFATGLAELDSLFASGRGLPYGQLIEIRGGVSSGKTSLLFTLLAGAASRPRRIAYVDFNNAFFPDATGASGIDLSRLLLIKPSNLCRQASRSDGTAPRESIGPGRPTPRHRASRSDGIDDIKDGIRTAELLFRDRHADIIVFDLVGRHTPLPIGLLHRLRLKTVRAKGLVIFLTQTDSRQITPPPERSQDPPEQKMSLTQTVQRSVGSCTRQSRGCDPTAVDIVPSSMASLRLEVQRLDDTVSNRHRITITKSRLCAEGIRLEVRL